MTLILKIKEENHNEIFKWNELIYLSGDPIDPCYETVCKKIVCYLVQKIILK